MGKFFKRGENVPRVDLLKMHGDFFTTAFVGAMVSHPVEGGTIVVHARMDHAQFGKQRIVSVGENTFQMQLRNNDVVQVMSPSGALLFRGRGKNLPLAGQAA